ncbi:hypothetical protein KCP73_20895 [Salmonella enterica subsp. enterica]|nr:hypothetical protein KCP73_20895 [Salmonella enterica subsp. enterica]
MAHDKLCILPLFVNQFHQHAYHMPYWLRQKCGEAALCLIHSLNETLFYLNSVV